MRIIYDVSQIMTGDVEGHLNLAVYLFQMRRMKEKRFYFFFYCLLFQTLLNMSKNFSYYLTDVHVMKI